MNHQWDENDFKTATQWGKILSWTLVATIAVGIAVFYLWDKITGLGRAIGNGFKKVGSFFGKLFTGKLGDSSDDSSEAADPEKEEANGPIKEQYDEWIQKKKESMV